MLRITPFMHMPEEVVLKLEGQIVGEWVPELEREAQRWLGRERRVLINLASVTFVDRRGLEMLRRVTRSDRVATEGPTLIEDLLRGGDEYSEAVNM